MKKIIQLLFTTFLVAACNNSTSTKNNITQNDKEVSTEETKKNVSLGVKDDGNANFKVVVKKIANDSIVASFEGNGAYIGHRADESVDEPRLWMSESNDPTKKVNRLELIFTYNSKRVGFFTEADLPNLSVGGIFRPTDIYKPGCTCFFGDVNFKITDGKLSGSFAGKAQTDNDTKANYWIEAEFVNVKMVK